MKFDKYIPVDPLKPYIRYLVVSENELMNTYKVYPSTGLVAGFQFKGSLSSIHDSEETSLSTAGITGLTDSFKQFRNEANTGTVLVYFTETGFAFFASLPVHELFNQSVSLTELFPRPAIRETEEKLSAAVTDRQRVTIVERFLLGQLRQIHDDRLIIEAVKLIYASKGDVRIKELAGKLCISQSPFEKRFRKLVGTSPKKFASIVRFNTVLNTMGKDKSLLDICYDNNFFDQAHFIKDFRKFTGDTPENFKRFL